MTILDFRVSIFESYRSTIGCHPRRCLICLHQPDMAVPEIVYQFLVPGGTHIARPDDFGSIDVRRIVDPLVVPRVMLGSVANNRELGSRIASKLIQRLCALQVCGRGGAPA